MHFVQVQNVHATVQLATAEAVCLNATFLLHRVGCWFESGQCVGRFRLLKWVKERSATRQQSVLVLEFFMFSHREEFVGFTTASL